MPEPISVVSAEMHTGQVVRPIAGSFILIWSVFFSWSLYFTMNSMLVFARFYCMSWCCCFPRLGSIKYIHLSIHPSSSYVAFHKDTFVLVQVWTNKALLHMDTTTTYLSCHSPLGTLLHIQPCKSIHEYNFIFIFHVLNSQVPQSTNSSHLTEKTGA